MRKGGRFFPKSRPLLLKVKTMEKEYFKISLINEQRVLEEFDLLDIADATFKRLLHVARIDNDLRDDFYQEIVVYLLANRLKLKGEYYVWAEIRAYRNAVIAMKMKTFDRSSKLNKTTMREDNGFFFEKKGQIVNDRYAEVETKDLLETAMIRAGLPEAEKEALRIYVEDCKMYSRRFKQGSTEYNNLFRAKENVAVVLSEWLKIPFDPQKKWYRPGRFLAKNKQS